MKTTNIKPCRSCGGPMIECRGLIASGKHCFFGDYYLKCIDCNEASEAFGDSDEGIELWNSGELRIATKGS